MLSLTSDQRVMMGQLEAAAISVIADRSGGLGVVLRAQYAVAEVVQRDFSGAGFFSTLAVRDQVEQLPAMRTLEYTAHAKFAGDQELGVMLFLNADGKLDFLEGFTYGPSSWDPSCLPALAVY